MFKVALITLHRVRNYGSSLQTLALQTKMEQMGANVEVIDYYPERYTSWGLLKRLKYKSKRLEKNPVLLLMARLAISPSYVKKKIVFDKFLKKNLKVTGKTYRTEEELLQNCPNADAYCTGSDQVWNSHWNEGVDAPFYLSFLPDEAKRFSYAASIGNAEVSQKEKDDIFPYLKKYQFLSVREDSGVKILEEMGFENVFHVLDPTLLLSREEWEPYVSNRFVKEKYVVTYNLHHDPELDRYAKTLAEQEGLKLYHISYNLHDIIRNGKLKWCPKVQEYLGLIKHAQYVVTDSFHATVFSLCFRKKFMALLPQEASSRISSLLHVVGLEQRGIHQWSSVNGIKEEIDYCAVETRMQTARGFSQRYLKCVLDCYKGSDVGNVATVLLELKNEYNLK